METVRSRMKIGFIKKGDGKIIFKQQSKPTFNGIHISFTNSDSFTFKQNGILMDKATCLGFAVLELSNFLMSEKYDKLQTDIGERNIQGHYIDTDAFVLSIISKDLIKGLKNLDDLFDFNIFSENHELFSNKNENCFENSI